MTFLAALAEATNVGSAFVILFCFFLVTVLIMRFQHGEDWGSSSVVRVQRRPVHVAVQKLFVPYTLSVVQENVAISRSSESTVSVRLKCDAVGRGVFLRWWWAVRREQLLQLLQADWLQHQQAVLTGRGLITSATSWKEFPEGIVTIHLEAPQHLSNSLGLGPPPRQGYPLVVVQLDPVPDIEGYRVGSVVTLLHVSDKECQDGPRVLYQYLKQCSGQFTLVTALYTQVNPTDSSKFISSACSEERTSTSDSILASNITSRSNKLMSTCPKLSASSDLASSLASSTVERHSATAEGTSAETDTVHFSNDEQCLKSESIERADSLLRAESFHSDTRDTIDLLSEDMNKVMNESHRISSNSSDEIIFSETFPDSNISPLETTSQTSQSLDSLDPVVSSQFTEDDRSVRRRVLQDNLKDAGCSLASEFDKMYSDISHNEAITTNLDETNDKISEYNSMDVNLVKNEQASQFVETIPEISETTSNADDLDCVVCKTCSTSLALLPCRHVCVCRDCFEQLMSTTQQACPLCRQRVHAYFEV